MNNGVKFMLGVLGVCVVLIALVNILGGNPENDGKGGDDRIAVAQKECNDKYDGMESFNCLNDYLATLWDHPNIKAAADAWWQCDRQLPGAGATRGGAMRVILPSGSWDDFPSIEEANEHVNEKIRDWNRSNPGVNCELAK